MGEEGGRKLCPEISAYTHFQTNEKAFWAYVKLQGSGSPRWIEGRNNKNLQQILSSIRLREPFRDLKDGSYPSRRSNPHFSSSCPPVDPVDRRCQCLCLCHVSSRPQCCGPVDCLPGLHKPYQDVYPKGKDSHLPLARRVVEQDDLYLPLSPQSPSRCSSYMDLTKCSSLPIPRCSPPAPLKLCRCTKPTSCMSEVHLPSPRPNTPSGSKSSFMSSLVALSDHNEFNLPCSEPLTPMIVEPVDFHLSSCSPTISPTYSPVCHPVPSSFPSSRGCADMPFRETGHPSQPRNHPKLEMSPKCEEDGGKDKTVGFISEYGMSPRCIDCQCQKKVASQPLCSPILPQYPCSPCLQPCQLPMATELLSREINCGVDSSPPPKCNVECDCHKSKGGSECCSTQIKSPDYLSPRCRDCACHKCRNLVQLTQTPEVPQNIEGSSPSHVAPSLPCIQSDIYMPHYETYFNEVRDEMPIARSHLTCNGSIELERPCRPLQSASLSRPLKKHHPRSFETYSPEGLMLKFHSEDSTSWNQSPSSQGGVTSRCCCGRSKCTETGLIMTTCPFCSHVHSCCCGMCGCPIPTCSSKSPILELDTGTPLPWSPKNNGVLRMPNYSCPKSVSSIGSRSSVGPRQVSPVGDVLVKLAPQSLSACSMAKSLSAELSSKDPHARTQHVVSTST
ncbi:unnamed protein product [Sphagnum balticum]